MDSLVNSLDIIVDTLPEYLGGLWMTVQLLVLSVLVGMVWALMLALMKRSGKKILSWPANVFIFYFRGTPFLIQMFLIYYGAGQFVWIKESVLWFFFQHAYFCALFALALNHAGYAAEILFNGIMNTPKGEVEAAESMGMTRWQILKNLILPSTFRRVIIAYGNEIIFMLHATSLVSVITLVDITSVASKVYQKYYSPLESYFIGALIYLAITFILTKGLRKLERKYHAHLSPATRL